MSIQIIEHTDKYGGSFHVIDTDISDDPYEACIGFFDTERAAEMFVASLWQPFDGHSFDEHSRELL